MCNDMISYKYMCPILKTCNVFAYRKIGHKSILRCFEGYIRRKLSFKIEFRRKHY